VPIRPENKDRYPDNWPEIRQSILERAGNCCEICGVRNHAVGYRDPCGEFVEITGYDADPDYWDGNLAIKIIKTVLTIMHLDHQPENCDLANLKAACQFCHNRYDAPVRAAGRKRRRRQEIGKTQNTLKFDSESAVSGSTASISAEAHQTSNERASNGDNAEKDLIPCWSACLCFICWPPLAWSKVGRRVYRPGLPFGGCGGSAPRLNL